MLIKKAFKFRTYPNKEQENSLVKDRIWTCFQCSTELDQDQNATINILNFNTVGTTEINAGGALVSRHSLKPEAALL